MSDTCPTCGRSVAGNLTFLARGVLPEGEWDVATLRERMRGKAPELTERQVFNVCANLVRRGAIRSAGYGRYVTVPEET